MTKSDVKDLFNLFKSNYNNFKYDDSMLKIWSEELSQYENDDVLYKTKELFSKYEFKTIAPTLYYILDGLPKVNEKIDYSKETLSCKFCGRMFNDRDKLINHEDRCRSIKYILKRTKELWNKDIDKKVLYNMNDSEFESKYELFLKKVNETTLNREEKLRINCIFNPPNTNVAKKIIGE